TDAARIALTRQGIPSGTIAVPARYIHSPTGLICRKDMENCVKLTVAAIKKIEKTI
ncbi:MAG: M42 family metallopeptidase, partial [Crenarchaeota archaeon]|nr:M42 family metallopeptidase [Thermoproteota archaeon]